MLISCPECGLQASDKALSCPHCGFPFQQNPSKPKIRKSNRRRRLPNGFGQITELKGRNLRKPFRVMVTTDKDDNGKPICKLLKPEAYFSTYNEAYEALVKYNKDPYNIDNTMTMQDLFERWITYHRSGLKSPKTASEICCVWNKHSSIKDMKIVDVRTAELRKCVYDNDATIGTKIRLKQILNMMLDYALEYQLIDRNYSRIMSIPKEVSSKAKPDKQAHIAFTNNELDTLWRHKGNLYVDMILFQCYSGWRPQEICILKTENIHLDENCMYGGMKTEAGEWRYVPIHPKIKEIVKYYYNMAVEHNLEYLFNRRKLHKRKTVVYKSIYYQIYWYNFNATISKLELNPKHSPHDGRKTFVTRAKRNGIDEYALKYIVGHVIEDVTEKFYTERDTSWLQSEMQKIR